MKQTILIANDHAGYDLKVKILEHLQKNHYNVIDLGAYSKDSVDYPDYAHKMAKQLHKDQKAILICGSGIGISIAANRHNNIRCALCHNEYTAELSRKHNNANVIALGARIIDENTAIKIVDIFLNTEFEGGRHNCRVDKINIGEMSDC